MIKRLSLLFLFSFPVIKNQVIAQKNQMRPVDYVKNEIGVLDRSSNCVIGPQLPFGSINPSPQTKNGRDDGYNPLEPIRGFGQLHVSGTGWGTNGQIFLSPQIGLAVEETSHDSPKSKESARPFEYAVTLNRYNIGVKVSPSYHSAIYKFSYPRSDSASLLLDITHNIPMDIKPEIKGEVSEGEIHFDDDSRTSFSGFGTYRGGFGGGFYTIYFVAKVDKKPVKYGTWLNGKVSASSSSQALINKNDRVGAYMGFATNENETIYLKVAVSYKSIEQAREWLSMEIPGWNFEKTKQTAKEIWNNALKKIEVEGGTEKDKTIFYTALYHAQLMPRNRTNDTKAFGKNVPFWDDQFAVWDTWRTVFPLHGLINQDVVAGVVNSFIARFKKNGIVKDGFANGNDMLREQGGNDVDNIMADAYVKRVPGIDWQEAYKILKFDADSQRLGIFAWQKMDTTLYTYRKTGWITAGLMSCSLTLEYNYNDYCAAMVAKGLGKKKDYQHYLARSGQWINFWNKNATSDGFQGFIVPRTLKGDFLDIDLKLIHGSWDKYFYEGSSWDYSWFMPHQFQKLIKLNGGSDSVVKKLNYGFKKRLVNFGNEPAFLTPFIFIHANRDDLTSFWVRKLMRESFTEKGYPGNDDSGAMSSWYVFSAMGFFPNAGQDFYYLFGPMFTKIKLHLSNGKVLLISAPNASQENIYVKSIKVNGKKWNSAILPHKMINEGGQIEFEMTNMSGHSITQEQE